LPRTFVVGRGAVLEKPIGVAGEEKMECGNLGDMAEVKMGPALGSGLAVMLTRSTISLLQLPDSWSGGEFVRRGDEDLPHAHSRLPVE